MSSHSVLREPVAKKQKSMIQLQSKDGLQLITYIKKDTVKRPKNKIQAASDCLSEIPCECKNRRRNQSTI